MASVDALLTIAEIAIALAGFSAVVAAFTIRGELTPRDRRRFLWLFTTAFVAALLAFAPIILTETGLAGSTLWRAASGIMILAWLSSAGILGVYVVRVRRDPSVPRSSFTRGPLLVVPSILNLLLQVMNVWGGIWQPSAAAYIVGNILWLYAASLVFMSIFLERPAS